MSNSYLQLLSYCISESYTGEDNQIVSEMMIAIGDHVVSNISLTENESYKNLFQIAEPFIILRSKYSSHQASPPSASDLELLISTLFWVKRKMSSDLKSFIVSSVILSCLSDKSLEFNEIISNLFINGNKNLLDYMLNITENFKFAIGIPDNAPLYEKDAIKKYLEAEQKNSYFRMVDFLNMVERGRGVSCSFIIEYATLYIIKNDFQSFQIILDKKTGLLEINMLLGLLPFSQLVQLAKMTKSKLVYFELTRLIFSNDRSSTLSNKGKSDLAESICNFLKNNEGCRSEFLRFFLKYPSRYSSLMEVIGQVVTKYEKDLLSAIVKIFPMNLSYKDQFNLLLNNMLDGLNLSDHHSFLKIIFEEWLFFYSSKSLNPYGHSLEITSMADGVSRYFIHMNSYEYFKFICEKIDHLNTIEETWHSTKKEFLIHIEKELSQFAVAAFAYPNRKFILPEQKIQNKIKYFFTEFSYKYQFALIENRIQTLNQISSFFSWVKHP